MDGMGPQPQPLDKVSIGKEAAPAPDALLTWYHMVFQLPETARRHRRTMASCIIEANGNGFIYVNGHCLGRYWQAGPQHDFFLPGNWLRFGSGVGNHLRWTCAPSIKG